VLSTDEQSKRLLFVGFGGLLMLLALFGAVTVSALRGIEVQNDTIRDDYFNRDRILEQLRSDIYLSGTYVRDLLLEPDPARVDLERHDLDVTRRAIERNVTRYQTLLRTEERIPFQRLRSELDSYFRSLRPALQWNAYQRQAFGYEFMRTSLLPRRTTIVHLEDQVAVVNQRQMAKGNAQITRLFSGFRNILVAFLVLTLCGGALLAAVSVRRVLRLETIAAMRLNEAERARESLRELSARLIDIQESERRVLSRELHDEIGQSVSALLLGIGNVSALVPTSSIKACDELAELRLLAEKTVAVARDMSLLLRPSMLDDLGLIPALQWQAKETSRNSNVFVQVRGDAISEDLPDEYKTCMFRIVQEALRNTVRHAHAKTVRVDLNQSCEALILTVWDDGDGISPDREKGLELLGMQERVAHLDGLFRVNSIIGKGTCLHVELPLGGESATVDV